MDIFVNIYFYKSYVLISILKYICMIKGTKYVWENKIIFEKKIE